MAAKWSAEYEVGDRVYARRSVAGGWFRAQVKLRSMRGHGKLYLLPLEGENRQADWFEKSDIRRDAPDVFGSETAVERMVRDLDPKPNARLSGCKKGPIPAKHGGHVWTCRTCGKKACSWCAHHYWSHREPASRLATCGSCRRDVKLKSNESAKGLRALAPEIARLAQKVYDEWAQDEEGYDEELGEGGICHLIAEEVVGLLTEHGFDAATVSATVGEQHVWAVAKADDGVYLVDIPPGVYESGGGYTWRKKPDVEFGAEHVIIDRESPDPDDFERFLED